MSDVKTQVSGVTPEASNEWLQVIRHFNESGAFSVRDICVVIGNPVGGVVGSARPDVETTYRNALSG